MTIEDMPLEVEFPGSTALARAAYRPRNRVLDLWWRQNGEDSSGHRYRYFDVPEAKYRALLAVHREGGSVGEFANHAIKPLYHYAPKDADEAER